MSGFCCLGYPLPTSKKLFIARFGWPTREAAWLLAFSNNRFGIPIEWLTAERHTEDARGYWSTGKASKNMSMLTPFLPRELLEFNYVQAEVSLGLTQYGEWLYQQQKQNQNLRNLGKLCGGNFHR